MQFTDTNGKINFYLCGSKLVAWQKRGINGDIIDPILIGFDGEHTEEVEII